MKKLSDVERVYIACSLDTEGSISLLKKRRKYCGMINYHIHFYPRLKVGNTNTDFLNYIKKILGIGNLSHNGAKWKENNWKKAYVIVIGSWQDIHDILEQIIPYLIIKKKQAELLLEACELHLPNLAQHIPYSKRMFEIQEEIIRLNKKGRIKE